MKKILKKVISVATCLALSASMFASSTVFAATTYYAKCASSHTSIVTALNSIGVDSSKANRTKIATLNGISNYTGTADQNVKMLNLLKSGKLIKSKTADPKPATTTTTTTTPTTTTTTTTTKHKYYNTYSTVSTISDRNSCSAMQGMAVGSTYLYTVKINGDDSRAIVSKTSRKTGKITNLKTKAGATYLTYLGHANDMDVATINGKSNLYVATMKTGSNSIVRLEVDGAYMTKKAGYTLKYNGANKSISGIEVLSKTSTTVNLLCKAGKNFYTGSIGINATSGTINLKKAFTIDMKSVNINGKTTDLSSFTHQGLGYNDGKVFVPVWAGGSKENQSVIAVYDIMKSDGTLKTGTLKSSDSLSFRITSGSYSFFEIESCGISGDGKLYFNTNRNGSDAVHYFKNYTFS